LIERGLGGSGGFIGFFKRGYGLWVMGYGLCVMGYALWVMGYALGLMVRRLLVREFVYGTRIGRIERIYWILKERFSGFQVLGFSGFQVLRFSSFQVLDLSTHNS